VLSHLEPIIYRERYYLFNTLASGGLRLKSSSLHMFLHRNVSADNCARELLKPSKDSTSFHICNQKIILVLFFFCE